MICNTYVQFFKTVAEPSRVELIYHLKKEPRCVYELVNLTKKEQSSISHNLRKLKEKGFVEATKQGKHRLYQLTKEGKALILTIDKYIKKYFHKDCRCKK